eukprot:130704_1
MSTGVLVLRHLRCNNHLYLYLSSPFSSVNGHLLYYGRGGGFYSDVPPVQLILDSSDSSENMGLVGVQTNISEDFSTRSRSMFTPLYPGTFQLFSPLTWHSHRLRNFLRTSDFSQRICQYIKPKLKLYQKSHMLSTFDILEKLGQGGFGSVWKVKSRDSGEFLAVKVVPISVSEEQLGNIDDILYSDKRFREIVCSLRTKQFGVPNVIRIHDFWLEPLGAVPSKSSDFGYFSESLSATSTNSDVCKEPTHSLCISMELCSRNTLFEWLNRPHRQTRRLECSGIVTQVARGLEGLHRLGIIHRDLKPSNILFDRNKDVKIIDFGLSTYCSDSNNFQDIRSQGVGTGTYGAPEQLSSKRYSEKVDIFSFGMIMCEIFHPFATMMERSKVLESLRNGRVPFSVRDAFPRMASLIQRCVGRVPNQRPSASEILNVASFPIP